MISPQTVEKIKETARVEEVVRDFVNLKKRGKNLLGLCPFHIEKTPSFTVNPSLNIYKCFGCGKGGDAIDFLKEHEHLTYPESLRWLAERYQIEIEETESTAEQKAEQDHRESLYIINRYAADFFIKSLSETEEGCAVAQTYFRERGYLESTIEKFELGWCPSSNQNNLTSHAIAEGYQQEYLEELGLTRSREGRSWDFYRDRVIFPIHNLSGKVIGFGGRTLKKEKRIPKYVNSPESSIYVKSKVLYGIYQGKRSIIDLDNCLLVEGYTDVISLHQAGITNVVASSGTALTPDQIRLIKRYTQNVTVLYDGDAAGIKAATRGTELILEQGMNVRIVLLPDAEDPDSAVRKMGAEGFRSFITEKARDFVLFKADLLLEESQGDPIRKAALIKEIVATIAKVPDPLIRSLYVKETALIMDVDEQLLIGEINVVKRRVLKKDFAERAPLPNLPADVHPSSDRGPDNYYGIPDPAAAAEINAVHSRELDLIRVLLESDGFSVEEKPAVVLILQETDNVELNNPVLKKILLEYRNGLEKNELPTSAYFLGHEDEEIKSMAIQIVQKPWEISPNWLKKHKVHITEKSALVSKDVAKTTGLLRYRKSEKTRDLLMTQIHDATLAGEIRTVNKCLELLNVLNKYRNQQLDDINHFVVNRVGVKNKKASGRSNRAEEPPETYHTDDAPPPEAPPPETPD